MTVTSLKSHKKDDEQILLWIWITFWYGFHYSFLFCKSAFHDIFNELELAACIIISYSDNCAANSANNNFFRTQVDDVQFLKERRINPMKVSFQVELLIFCVL